MRRRVFFIILFFLWFVPLFAQERLKQGITLAYFNDKAVIPGARLGYELPVWESEREKSNNRSVIRGLVLKLNVSFYRHRRSHTAFLFNASIGYRFTNNVGVVFEPLHLGLGATYSFLAAPTYQVSNNSLEQVRNAGNFTFALPYIKLLGLGYDFRKKMNLPFSTFVSMDVYMQRNINQQSRLRLSIPVGFTYFFK